MVRVELVVKLISFSMGIEFTVSGVDLGGIKPPTPHISIHT